MKEFNTSNKAVRMAFKIEDIDDCINSIIKLKIASLLKESELFYLAPEFPGIERDRSDIVEWYHELIQAVNHKATDQLSGIFKIWELVGRWE
jgi:hypothetical protein